MKLGMVILLAILGGCAAPPRPAPEAVDVRGSADALRVDHEYRPAPTGSDILAVSYDHPPRSYYANYRCFPTRWLYEHPRYSRRCD